MADKNKGGWISLLGFEFVDFFDRKLILSEDEEKILEKLIDEFYKRIKSSKINSSNYSKNIEDIRFFSFETEKFLEFLDGTSYEKARSGMNKLLGTYIKITEFGDSEYKRERKTSIPILNGYLTEKIPDKIFFTLSVELCNYLDSQKGLLDFDYKSMTRILL